MPRADEKTLLISDDSPSSTTFLNIELMKKSHAEKKHEQFAFFPSLVPDIKTNIIFLFPPKDLLSFGCTSKKNYEHLTKILISFPEKLYEITIYRHKIKINHLRTELNQLKIQLAIEKKYNNYELCHFETNVTSIKPRVFCYAPSSFLTSIGCGACTFFSGKYAAAASLGTGAGCLAGSGAVIGAFSTIMSLGFLFYQFAAIGKSKEKQREETTLKKKIKNIEVNINKNNLQITAIEEKINTLRLKR